MKYLIKQCVRIRIKIKIFNTICSFCGKILLVFKIRSASKLKINIGSCNIGDDGWILTDIDTFNIVDERAWEKLFRPDSIDNLFAEHVLEHLTDDELKIALKNAFYYLKPGSTFRIAVPDGNRNDPIYISEVKPPIDGHKQYFSCNTLPTLLEEHGFIVNLLEYFDSDHKFQYNDWNEEYGVVRRSMRYDKQIKFKLGNLNYTSLIVDAIKPMLEKNG